MPRGAAALPPRLPPPPPRRRARRRRSRGGGRGGGGGEGRWGERSKAEAATLEATISSSGWVPIVTSGSEHPLDHAVEALAGDGDGVQQDRVELVGVVVLGGLGGHGGGAIT